MNITFYGARGSTPSPGEANRRYGGNTATVVLEHGNDDPIVFDLGTGLRLWGQQLGGDRQLRATAQNRTSPWRSEYCTGKYGGHMKASITSPSGPSAWAGA